MVRARNVLSILFILSTAIAIACGDDDDESPGDKGTGGTGADSGVNEPTCTGCDIQCNDQGACNTVCAPSSDCSVTCDGVTHCMSIGCTSANNCSANCAGEAACDEIDCTGANNCEVDCRDTSSCNIDCTSANNCDMVHCRAGAKCLLICTGANNCGFATCGATGGATTCPDNVVVCNRDCPSCGDGACDLPLESATTCADDCG